LTIGIGPDVRGRGCGYGQTRLEASRDESLSGDRQRGAPVERSLAQANGLLVLLPPALRPLILEEIERFTGSCEYVLQTILQSNSKGY
jgi:hypothetical protein